MARAWRVVCAGGVLAAALSCRSSASPGDVAILSCSAATTLDGLGRCIVAHMPQQASDGYVPPDASERADWRRVVRAMLNGRCGPEMSPRLAHVMQLRTFHDGGNDRSYCVLMEVLDADRNGFVDRGWGTFIVNPDARRELHHQAPHPLNDASTDRQALAIFRATESRGYLLAGTHRYSNAGSSMCQRDYGPADPAHNIDNMFQATTEELKAYYGDTNWWVIQWHGMAETDCKAVNVYMTHGRGGVAPVPSDKIYQLKERLLERQPAWQVDVAGSPACALTGGTNVQGRLLNGVPAPDVCRTSPNGYSGRFLHIEQDPAFRSAADWVEAVSDVWPEVRVGRAAVSRRPKADDADRKQ
jgi:hypothetical protein